MSIDDQAKPSPGKWDFAKKFGESLENDNGRIAWLYAPIFGQRIRMGYLRQLLHRVGSGLRAGIDIRKIWEQESRHGPMSYRPVFAELLRRAKVGDSITDAVRDAGQFFPPMVREMVYVGEHTGKLDEVLLRLSDHYQHMIELRRTFLFGIAWPLIQLVFAVVIVGVMIWLVGYFAEGSGQEPIDYLGVGLVGTRGAIIYAMLVSLTFAAVVLVILAIRSGWLGSTGWRIALKIPLLGKCLETMALARLTWTLSLALESGAYARHSLRMALGAAQLPLYSDRIEQGDQAILRGVQFHEAMTDMRVFPDEFLHALEAAEISGRLSESMFHLSNEYKERAAASLRMLTGVAMFLIYGGVACLLVFLIFRIFSAYVNLLNSFL